MDNHETPATQEDSIVILDKSKQKKPDLTQNEYTNLIKKRTLLKIKELLMSKKIYI